MRCPYCKADDDRVIDSRSIGEGNTIRRRRECQSCSRRFTTYERTEVAPVRVIKKDQSRESFRRDKILKGLFRACEKRNVSLEDLEGLVSRIEARIADECSGEVSTKQIGEMVSEALRELDHVAYVRFASVYREFKDVEQFLQEVVSLVRPGSGQPGGVHGEAAESGETVASPEQDVASGDPAAGVGKGRKGEPTEAGASPTHG